MCGFVGIGSVEPINSKDWLLEGCDNLSHRGPDDSGLWWSVDNKVGLGHRRLSIVDLSSMGHQPMHDIRGEFTIVFNGEIYNHSQLRKELSCFGHSFKSFSDTEVILTAYIQWGPECLKHFRGMFAFAIHDSQKQSIFMARDRAGEKPLFYNFCDGVLIFASELKAILVKDGISRNVNRNALDTYLSMGYIPQSECILQGFNKLPPGHYCIFDLNKGDIQTTCYWTLPKNVSSSKNFNRSIASNLISELETLLDKSVQEQLVADVPVGILLSGGLDSSLITSIATRFVDKIDTFTVVFPNHGKHDESLHAREIANYFKTEHIELNADEISPELLIPLARQFDEPIVDSSILPTFLVSQLISQKCKVALGGDGADELFGGYHHYSRLIKLARLQCFLPSPFCKVISAISTRFLPHGYKGRNWLNAISTNLNAGVPQIGYIFDFEYRKKLLSGSELVMDGAYAENIWKSSIPDASTLIDRATRMDFKNYLPGDILYKVDRSSMLNSLEVRAPFLSVDLIEFAFSKVPDQFKVNSKNRKIILRMLAQKILPDGFNVSRKQGFSIPIMHWLRYGKWRDFFSATLYAEDCIFDKDAVQALFDGIDSGRYNGERLFGLVMFELWRKEYGIHV